VKTLIALTLCTICTADKSFLSWGYILETCTRHLNHVILKPSHQSHSTYLEPSLLTKWSGKHEPSRNPKASSISLLVSNNDDQLGSNLLTTATEMRNLIYEYCVSAADGPSAALGLGHACRTTRLEYMPLFFRLKQVTIPFILISHFLQAFYPEKSPFPFLPNCNIFGDYASEDNWQYKGGIDIKWLAAFLQTRPRFSVKAILYRQPFSNSGICLAQLLKLVVEKVAWRTRLEEFSAITLYARRGTEKNVRKGFYRTDWVLEIVTRPEKMGTLMVSKKGRRDQADLILEDFGLLERIPVEYFRLPGSPVGYQDGGGVS
jgi:hypothetical protein